MDNSSMNKYCMRNSHTVSLEKFDVMEPISRYSVHDPKLIVNRASCYPALSPDNSADLVNETVNRRSMHRDLLSKNKNIFKHVDSNETKFQVDCIKSKVLGDIHILKDPFVNRNFFYSRAQNPPPADIEFPAKDFAYCDPNQDRTSGYSSGHIRSVLHLDSIGPHDSKRRQDLISSGLIPESPNLDRYCFDQTKTKSSTISGTVSVSGKGDELKLLNQLDMTNHSSHERALHWHSTYISTIKNRERQRVESRRKEDERRKMDMESKFLSSSIDEFEQHLSVAMMSV